MNEEIQMGAKKAVEFFGSANKMHKAIGITHSMITCAARGEKKFGPEVCLKIARVTGGAIKPRVLRPDIDWEAINL